VKKVIALILILVISVGCTNKKSESHKITVLTGIDPVKTFVEKVTGDKAKVESLIKEGSSPAISKFTTKQITSVEDADIYFYTGVPAEVNIVEKLTLEDLKIIDLLDKVGKVYPNIEIDEHHDEEETDHHQHEKYDHNHGPVDPHIWLSPKRAIEIVKIIKSEMIELDPANEEFYSDNADEYIEKLESLDEELKSDLSGENILVFHSSFAYFADDYGLNMIVVEENGKKASIKKLTKIIEEAKDKNIDKVFYQQEFDRSQVESIAEELGVELLELKALTGDYINNLIDIKNKIKDKKND
jgi:zinc transport system substrate-binding protein